ncbi:MAG: hypothetical protein L6420_10805 [Elusimicrobia bacterium]|nr:hypothetical protein [Elusimicrobiota bacterium]
MKKIMAVVSIIIFAGGNLVFATGIEELKRKAELNQINPESMKQVEIQIPKISKEIDSRNVMEIGAEEFKDSEFIALPGQIGDMKLKIEKDGSWTIQTTLSMRPKEKSGKSFQILDRMEVWGDGPGQLMAFGVHGGSIRLMPKYLREQVKKGTGIDADYVLEFFYGSRADGECLILVRKITK